MPGDDGPGIAFAPRMPSTLVARPHLVEQIHEGAQHPLLILRAAAGGGKSTAVATWATARPRKGVWIRLDRSTPSRLTFWQRVVDAIVAAELAPAGSVLRELVISPDIADDLTALLYRGFFEVKPFTIVLDDFHEVLDEAVPGDIHWLLERGVPVQIVVLTRTKNALERPDLMARVDTAIVLPADLAFDAVEVVEAARLFDAPDAADEIYRAFAGWPLSTRAALLQLQKGGTDVPSAIEQVRAVGDSFTVDALDDTGYGEFLLRTSVAHRLSPELAAVIGGSLAEEHLARAERDGLGMWLKIANRDEFAVHAHLRERLEREFARRHPEEVFAARAAYAQDRVKNSDPVEAARQYAAIGDLGALVDVVRAFHADLIGRGVYSSMLDGVDESALRHHPELIAVRMLAAYADPSVRTPGLIQQANLAVALGFARIGGGAPVDRVSLLLTALGAQRLSGHYDQAVKTVERLLTALDQLSEKDRHSLRGVIPSAWIHAATTFIYDEQTQRVQPLLDAAVDAADAVDNPWPLVHAESLNALVLAMRGDARALAPLLESARKRERPSGWRGTYSSAGYHLAEAYAALEQFDHETANQQVDTLAPHESTIEHWPLIARVRALASLVGRTPYLGLQVLSSDIAAHAERPPTSRSMTAILTATQADLLVADRQPRRALDLVRGPRRDPLALLVRARAFLLLGDNPAVLRHVVSVPWAERDMPRAKAEALLLIAVASHRLNQQADSRDAAERAIALLDSYALRRPLMTVPRQDLVAALDAAGIPHEDLLAGVPDLFPLSSRDWSLTASELRVLAELERTGSTDALAASLRVSANTVKSHLRQIYRKLEVSSRAEALGVARLHGILDDASAEPH